MAKSAELLQGTLDLLILRTLELQPLHGVGIADRIEQVTRGVFVVGPGSLFPAAYEVSIFPLAAYTTLPPGSKAIP